MRFKKFLSTVCASALLFSSIFCCKAENPTRCAVTFVGDSQTGKTSICNVLKGCGFCVDIVPTEGANFLIQNDQNNDVTLLIWDIGGQECFHNILIPHFLLS